MTTLFSDVAAHADPRGQIVGLWARRAVLTVFAAIAVLGLLDVFGQGAAETTAGAAARPCG